MKINSQHRVNIGSEYDDNYKLASLRATGKVDFYRVLGRYMAEWVPGPRVRQRGYENIRVHDDFISDAIDVLYAERNAMLMKVAHSEGLMGQASETVAVLN